MKQTNSIKNTKGVLYIVPIPIGNLNDISQRALTILSKVDLIAAEDTRNARTILKQFSIHKQLISLHNYNEEKKTEYLLEILQKKRNIALISDAGTPLISDPGYYIVRQCREANIQIIPLPGPCAAITALSAAGIPSNRFCFEGFLSSKTKIRQNTLRELAKEKRTLIFYESTHRLLNTLEDMAKEFGNDRYVVLARELTKKWESIKGSKIMELLIWIKENEYRKKGEIVLVVEGNKKKEKILSKDAINTLEILQKELSLKKSVFLTSKIYGIKKNILYKFAINQKIYNNRE